MLARGRCGWVGRKRVLQVRLVLDELGGTRRLGCDELCLGGLLCGGEHGKWEEECQETSG